MGGSKATARLAGRPLISYPIAAARDAGLDPIVVAKRRTQLPRLDVPRVTEPERPQHPLCGVLAALDASRGAAVLALGCDMPFLDRELLAWLAEQPGRLVVADAGAGLQPLLARYEPALAGRLAHALDQLMPMRELVASMEPRVVGPAELARFGDPERICFNVNTPDDLARAELMVAQSA
jgi:molybdopterin-guanine dinucleotide biosynthesis protein A